MLLARSTGAVNAYHRPDLPTSLNKMVKSTMDSTGVSWERTGYFVENTWNNSQALPNILIWLIKI
jgi:hypothetical protein